MLLPHVINFPRKIRRRAWSCRSTSVRRHAAGDTSRCPIDRSVISFRGTRRDRRMHRGTPSSRPAPASTAALDVGRHSARRSLHDHRLSRVHGAGNDLCAEFARWRRPRHPSARHSRSCRDRHARTPECRLLDCERRRSDDRPCLHDATQRFEQC